VEKDRETKYGDTFSYNQIFVDVSSEIEGKMKNDLESGYYLSMIQRILSMTLWILSEL